MLISVAFQRYCEDVIHFTNQSKCTEESHNTTLKLLLVFFGDVAIEGLTFEMIRLWKLELGKTQSPNTVRGYIIKLRVVLKYCERIGLSVINTDLIPVPKREETVPKFITPEEVTQLINATRRTRSKAIISLLYSSGIRISELCKLDRGAIYNHSFTVMGKGNKPRLCFLDERTEALLEQYLATREDNHPALFLSTQSERRMTPTNIQLIFKSACKNAGINKKITPHTMRHSFATNLLQNNTNMRYVQEMLGHSSLQTTQMYSHVVNEDLRAVFKEKHTI